MLIAFRQARARCRCAFPPEPTTSFCATGVCSCDFLHAQQARTLVTA